ncbi:MAG TPA: hypothetical protein PLG59_01865 [bacterium]|nr:hypothetical protein [bacterium]HQO33378.1 hypothetical protein [bacterium]HQP97450.1 hypothetical protein [bacterium]
MTEKTSFSVAYGGELLESGLMDINQLAPALLSLGQLLDEANKTLNGDRSRLQVKVSSDFKSGSFDIFLELTQRFVDQIGDLLHHTEHYSPTKILQFLGLTPDNLPELTAYGASLIVIYKFLKGERPPKIEMHNTETNTYIIYNRDGESKEVPGQVADLLKNEVIRESIDGVIKPLETEGIDTFSTRVDCGERSIIIAKDEAQYFRKPHDDVEQLSDSKRTCTCIVISASFDEKYIWRFSDGQSSFNAKIVDQEFWKKIDAGGESFSKGDALTVELQSKQIRRNRKLTIENEIIRVIDHVRGYEQGSLFEHKE